MRKTTPQINEPFSHGKTIRGAAAIMNAFSKLRTLALFAVAIFLSAPPAFAEDIEIYLYQNEGSGANILLLIDLLKPKDGLC